MYGLGDDSMWFVVGCGVCSVRPKERPVDSSYGFFLFALRFMGLFLRLFLFALDWIRSLHSEIIAWTDVSFFIIFPRNCQYCTLYLSIGYGVELTVYTKRNLVRNRG